MKYAVAVKQIPNTMEMYVDENGSLVRAGVPTVLDLYDEYALTRVLDMKGEGDEVVVFTRGPDQVRETLKKCFELGADESVPLN